MRKILIFITLCLCYINCVASPIIGYNPAIEPYINFLRTANISSVDYVINLFDKYDIVILAETDHLETTQWNFITSVISDKRFINKVGNVFTETGSVSIQPQLEDFFKAPQLDTNLILQMMHNFMPAQEGWDRNNYYEFLKSIYTLNKGLAPEQKVNLYFSDQPSTWDQFTTPYQYKIFYDLPGSGDYINPRDRIMAMRIFTKFQNVIASSPRKKALVIMNTRHAFGPIKELDMPKWAYIGQNVGGYLIEWMPGQVANVMLNTACGSEIKEGGHLLQDGKWDAAFLYLKNPRVGFDLAGSPFGADMFDYGQAPNTCRYQDVFTGMVFTSPLQEHWVHDNIPGFYDPEYKITVEHRTHIACGDKGFAQCYKDITDLWAELESHPEKHDRPLYKSDFLEPMKQWLVYDK